MSFSELGYAFVNTPGIGGIVVMSVIIIAITVYVFLTRWIIQGGQEESETASRPQRIE
ncbi:MAG: hypothetical protein Kow0080_33420 [Candidatus Promineifilaceae bacterium]